MFDYDTQELMFDYDTQAVELNWLHVISHTILFPGTGRKAGKRRTTDPTEAHTRRLTRSVLVQLDVCGFCVLFCLFFSNLNGLKILHSLLCFLFALKTDLTYDLVKSFFFFLTLETIRKVLFVVVVIHVFSVVLV